MTHLGAGALALLALAAGEADPVFDVKVILAPPLEARVLKSTEADGIVTEEVTFYSETDATTRVEIFAFFSYPKGAHHLPAYVWNQGGGARADPSVTQEGARRGYATLCIDLPMPGYRSTGGYRIVDGLELPGNPRSAPIAHGAVALLRAVSFLASRAEVDPTRIGMVGSSWGGFFATLQAGLDPRLRAVASMFGAGRLDLGNPWWDGHGKKAPPEAALRERWRTTLDPALRLPHARVPIAWFAGTNDQFYWLPSLSRTFEEAGAPKHLALLAGWNHALNAPLDAEVFAWLDAQLKGGAALPEVGPLSITPHALGNGIRFAGSGPRPLVAAEILVSAGEGGHWTNRCWAVLPAALENGTGRAELAASSLPLWVTASVIDAAGFRASTAVTTLQPRATRGAAGVPACDGAALWGDFEPAAEEYLSRHGLKVPEWSDDAALGRRSARLNGKAAFPLHYTAGLPHRFTCRVKAAHAGEIDVRLAGRFDGKPVDVGGRFPVGPHWSDVVLELTPPQSALASLNVRFETPPGTAVLVDAVAFRLAGPGSR